MVFKLSDFPQRTSELRSLIQNCFPKGSELTRNCPIEEEFVLLLSKQNEGHIFFVTEDDSPNSVIVSSASYRIFSFAFDQQQLKVAAIGLVVTHPDFRKKGFSETILKTIEEKAKSEGAALSVLWSDLDEFYKKRGYWPSGSELQWDLSNVKAVRHSNFKAERITDLGVIRDFYQTNEYGPERNWQQYNQFLKLSDTQIYGATVEGAHQVTAYIAFGKGRDLRSVVHEFGGDLEGVAFLVEQLKEKYALQRFLSPPENRYEDFFSRRFQADSMRAALAYFKIIDFPKAVDFINAKLPSETRVQITNSQWQVLWKGKSIFESQDPAHFLQIFFGPWKPVEMEDLPPDLAKALKSWELKRLYFWGFDSV